jgi:chromosome partitioning protein
VSHVVSFINMKGGVGKTTLAVNVGYTLSKHFGKRVLLIDADPQMNATQYTLNKNQISEIMENPKKSLYSILSYEYKNKYHYDYSFPTITSSTPQDVENLDVIFKIDNNFDIIPSHLEIMNLDLDKKTPRLNQYILNNKLKKEYDIILIDLAPTISAYTAIALLASDKYLVPMKTDYLSLLGLPLLENYIHKLNWEQGLNIEFMGIILTMVRSDFVIYKEVKGRIDQVDRWRDKLFKNELKYTTDVEKALSPQRKEENKLPYLIELDNSELTSQMIGITQEFMQCLRL